MSAVATAVPLLVYFSSVSGNTARFIEKLGLEVFGTQDDVDRVSDGLERWWKRQ